jgi:hypothetical protein
VIPVIKATFLPFCCELAIIPLLNEDQWVNNKYNNSSEVEQSVGVLSDRGLVELAAKTDRRH